jgi:hypothetical protein
MLEDRTFSLQNDNQIYFGDVFIGYQKISNSRIFIDALNYDKLDSLPKNIVWTITETGLFANGNTNPVIDIKNLNFNTVIWNRLHFIPEFKEKHNYYVIACNNLYANFLSSSFKETVKMLTELKQKASNLDWKIKPVLI